MTEVHEIREMHCFPVFLGSSFNVVRLLQSKLETFVNFPFFVYCRLCHRFRIGKRLVDHAVASQKYDLCLLRDWVLSSFVCFNKKSRCLNHCSFVIM